MITKVMKIEGMSCEHCKRSVEKVLGKISGVDSAVVDLDAKTATLELAVNVEDQLLMDAVNEEGFTAVAVESK